VISNTVQAAEKCPSAVLLRVGDRVSDCERIGLNLQFEKTVREQVIQNDYNLKIIEEQKKIIDLKDLTIRSSQEQAQLWKEEAERARKKYDEASQTRSKDFLYGLIGGVILTALAGWTVGQVAKSAGK
jgi:hypothetical protein